MNALFVISLGLAPLRAEQPPSVLVVIGAPGTPEYGTAFRAWSEKWEAAAKRGSAKFTCIGREPVADVTDRDRLRAFLQEQGKGMASPLWVVLIGHGTDDGREARFNLHGPDVSARELAEWVAPLKRPVAVVNCASASGSFVNLLSGPDRVVVTATRHGSESNYARFGQHFAEAIGSAASDLDKDGQVSLLEAYLTAASKVAESYKGESRLATEHALLDDNGDKLGSPAEWFRGVRAVKRAKDGAAADGSRAHQWHLVPSAAEKSMPAPVRGKRDELELELAKLRERKETLPEVEYYSQLEVILVKIASLYEEAAKAGERGR